MRKFCGSFDEIYIYLSCILLYSAWAPVFVDLYYGIGNGTIPIEYLDNALKRVLPSWFKLGLIDNPNSNPWSNLSLDTLYPQHQKLAFEMAVKSMIII